MYMYEDSVYVFDGMLVRGIVSMTVCVYGYVCMYIGGMGVSNMELCKMMLLFCSDNFLEISFQQLQKGIDFNSLLCEDE